MASGLYRVVGEAHSSTPADDGRHRLTDAPARRRRNLTLSLFSVTTVLLFADQNLMSPNLTAIANEFGFNEEERDQKLGGDISLAFFLLGAPAMFMVGCLADTCDRSMVFALTVFVGEGACFATYWVKTYSQLYVCRAITGFSIGGALPLIYSTLGDLFAAEERHVVSAAVSFGTGAGIAVGQAVAGFLGPTFGWRLPFLVVSVPALLCALAVLLTVEDPERGAMERAVLEQNEQIEGGVTLTPISPHSETISSSSSSTVHSEALDQCKLVTTDPSSRQEGALVDEYFEVVLAVVQGAPGCVPWGIINVFLNDYLSEDRGFSVETATATLMCFSAGHAVGLLLGGAGGRYLYQRDPRLPALLAGFMALLGCLPFWLLLNIVDSSTPGWLVVLLPSVAGFCSGPTGPIIKATMTNVTHPRVRGQAFALFNLFDDFGKGLGPFFVATLIVQMGGRLPAFNIAILGWVACGIANLAIFFTVRQDEARVQEALSAQLRSSSLGSGLNSHTS